MSESGFTGLKDWQDYGLGIAGKEYRNVAYRNYPTGQVVGKFLM
jgi:hypothetical protein